LLVGERSIDEQKNELWLRSGALSGGRECSVNTNASANSQPSLAGADMRAALESDIFSVRALVAIL
jgi:hypothetical protein